MVAAVDPDRLLSLARVDVFARLLFDAIESDGEWDVSLARHRWERFRDRLLDGRNVLNELSVPIPEKYETVSEKDRPFIRKLFLCLCGRQVITG